MDPKKLYESISAIHQGLDDMLLDEFVALLDRLSEDAANSHIRSVVVRWKRDHGYDAGAWPRRHEQPRESVVGPNAPGKTLRAKVREHLGGAQVRVRPDHPYIDPGDGRTECATCGKYVWPAIHSCKGVPVTDRARLGAAKCTCPEPGASRWPHIPGCPQAT